MRQYNWIAQDSNGTICKYVDRPVKGNGNWHWVSHIGFGVRVAKPEVDGDLVHDWYNRIVDLRESDWDVNKCGLLVAVAKEEERI